MKNIDKMNELVGSEATIKQVVDWAYMNRVWLCDLPDEDEFQEMKFSVESFLNKENELRHEQDMWRDFLVSEFVEEEVRK